MLRSDDDEATLSEVLHVRRHTKKKKKKRRRRREEKTPSYDLMMIYRLETATCLLT
jgi:hypothetical protein